MTAATFAQRARIVELAVEEARKDHDKAVRDAELCGRIVQRCEALAEWQRLQRLSAGK